MHYGIQKIICAVACGAALPSTAFADPPTATMEIIREKDTKWITSRFGPDYPIAMLEGDPTKDGVYMTRVKYLPGRFTTPHFHRGTRYIVVLKGIWWVGAGPKGDPEETTPLAPGTVVIHHGGQIHYDGAKQEEVEVLVLGLGPESATEVDKTGKPTG